MSDEQNSRKSSGELPDWFVRLSPLSMDPLVGPDAQYRAGARDMLAVLTDYPSLLDGRRA